MTPVLAEFIGTAVMLLLGTGVCANVSLARTKGNGAGWIVVIVTWAMAVFTGVVIAGPYSGAHLNPSVTLAFARDGAVPVERRAGLRARPDAGRCGGRAGHMALLPSPFRSGREPRHHSRRFLHRPRRPQPGIESIERDNRHIRIDFHYFLYHGRTPCVDRRQRPYRAGIGRCASRSAGHPGHRRAHWAARRAIRSTPPAIFRRASSTRWSRSATRAAATGAMRGSPRSGRCSGRCSPQEFK